MKKTFVQAVELIVIVLVCAGPIPAKASPQGDANPGARADGVGLSFPRVAYEARVSNGQARVVAELEVESTSRQETGIALFEGDLAMLPPKLPASLRIERRANTYWLFVSRPGRHPFEVHLLAKVKEAELWNQFSFMGPSAAIASVTAQADGENVDLQLLSGTQVSTERFNGLNRVKGFLGGDRAVTVRWSGHGQPGDKAHKAVVTAETSATAQATPTLIKYATQIRYDALQGSVSKLLIAMPQSHTLTRLVGEQIRDWEIKPATDPALKSSERRQVLEIQLIKPIEHRYELTVYSEQTVESLPSSAQLNLPEPLGLEREAGSLSVSTQDTAAEVANAQGLRQVNALSGALAAYRFNGRPFTLALNLRRIEPEILVSERVRAVVEDTRLLSRHALELDVEKAGVYGVDLLAPEDFSVAEVKGAAVEDWKTSRSNNVEKVHVSFTKRLLGKEKLEVALERPLKVFPERVELGPVRVMGAAKQVSEIGAAAAPGIRLKTSELMQVREVAVRTLKDPAAGAERVTTQELLGYRAEQADWKLILATERLSARVIADVFNLVTIGDGIVGGSATIRYGLLNQGVQQFQIALPAAWKNVDFTGPNIRRKEQSADGTWTIGLQDKAWGGYTLVVTYDFQFDSKGATLALGGIHAKGVERETGSVAVTTASSMKLAPGSVSETLRRVDELELPSANRALITRPVLLAYEYNEPQYQLEVQAQRFQEVNVLSAVADRTQLTTVLTQAGEMLTQASFMVKNNDKQFQRFKLPSGARFWSCHVNGQPVKAEKDGGWVMAPLPRGANRNQAFAVDIVYASMDGIRPGAWPRTLQLQAPQTDVPNTYAEWQLYAPATFQLSSLGGNMTAVRGTTYDLQDAWEKFTRFYREFLHESGPPLLLALSLVGLVVALIGSAARRGASGVISVLVVFAIVAILAGMLLPALSRAKARAQRINGLNNLKQIGLAARTFALDNTNRLPNSFEEMMNELSMDKITYDPETGLRYIYVGAGYDLEKILPESIIAYSPPNTRNYRDVVLADGSVQQLSGVKFEEMERRGLILPATPQQVARNQQEAAVRNAQFQTPDALSAAALQPSDSSPAFSTALGPKIRSIHIEIPRAGQSLTFTKVLHLDSRPLLLHVRLMSLRVFQTIQMCLQVAAFVSGLLLGWREWRTRRSSLMLTIALSLCLGAVGSLLLAWRLLHLAFIWTAPICVLTVLGWITWKFWPRRRGGASDAAPHLTPGLPPAVATFALLGCCLSPLSAAPPPARERPVSVTSALYSLAITDQVAKVDVTLTVNSTAPNQRLFLFEDDVAVQRFAPGSSEAKLVREDAGVSAVMPHRGTSTLQLSLAVKLGGDVTKRQLGFAVPDALSSHWDVLIDQPDADVEFPAAIWVRQSTAGSQTRVEALMGPGERAQIQWTPRVKRAAEIAANVICHSATLLTVGSAVLSARTTLDYQVTQGEMRQIRVRLPRGHRLLQVEGESIRTWELATENGEQVVKVELLKGVAPQYRLSIETEKVLGPLPADLEAEIPHPAGVSRETGLLALKTDEELDVAFQATADLYRVDAEEFMNQSARRVEGALNTFRFLKPDFKLQLRISAMQPQLEAVVHNHVRVSPEQVGLTSLVDYTTKRVGVFRLRLALPEQYRLESVSGSNVLQTVERTDAPGPRILELTLKERTTGTYPLRLELRRPFKELPPTIAIEGARPLDVQKLSGLVLVLVEPGVALKPATFQGLSEIPAGGQGTNDASTAGSGLAYKFISADPQSTPSWQLAVQTERVESWVRAEFVTTLTISETLVNGRALARFDVQNAPIKELHLKIPEAFKNVEISAPNIRRSDHSGESWTVEFQSKIRGPNTLTITWEQPRTEKTNDLQLHGIAAEGVERETGVLVVVARPPLQVVETSAPDLKPTDLRDVPDWAGSPDEGAVLAYRYIRPGYTLGVSATRFAEAEVLQVLVESLNLSTVLADDGQTMTEMSLLVRNRNRQYLEISLPAGATVWSAFVAGQPIRPSLNSGKLLLPLEQSMGDDSAIPIDLIYVDSRAFPKNRGTVELVSPKLDAPLQSAHWELFLPPDYAYSNFGGSMAHEVEATSIEASGFSLLDYSSRESTSKARLASELKSDLSSAQQKLSSGNVKEAMADYNRARVKSDLASANNVQARQIEAELRRAQGNNLIEAQNSFSLNYATVDTQGARNGSGFPTLQYANQDAEAQWAKLQQAQDLGATTVQPIHVNLPTRGLHHSFSQLLQTQSGRPLTIRLFASNTRTHAWPQRVAASMGGFLILWAIVFLLTRAKTHAAHP